METKQPTWKLAGTVGDIHPLDYSGGFVYVDTTGVYPPELEWIEAEPDSEQYSDYDLTNDKWTVYRFPLDRCELAQVNGEPHLVPFGFPARTDLPHPIASYVEWFDERLNDVAITNGASVVDYRHMLTSDSPMGLAMVYMILAQYHGWENFDSDPLTFTNREEIEKRYKN